jgi:hypothetical protein
MVVIIIISRLSFLVFVRFFMYNLQLFCMTFFITRCLMNCNDFIYRFGNHLNLYYFWLFLAFWGIMIDFCTIKQNVR